MNDQRIAILTDSGTNTPLDFAREHDVRIVPLLINYKDGSTYKSGVDITTQEVIDHFDTEIPSTSLPAPQQILSALEQARDDGYTCGVFVTISGTLSATYQTVCMVSRLVDDFPLVVIDTKSIGVVAGMVVMQAVRMVEDGVPFGELNARLRDLAEQSDVFFATKTLDYLYHGGRINTVTYRLGSALNIKPVITCDKDGRYVVARKARGWDRAIDTQVRLVRDRAARYPAVRVGICCTNDQDLFDQLEDSLRAQIDNIAEVVRSGLTPDLIVHTGPDLVGLGVQPA
ncbi:MAG: DegV family protein [Coriobacteriales bacterium]|nr:DegV family protein [Coriobacteriales bacterium]